MPRIFISYRRADSQAIVGRIHEHLARAFGPQNVFMDVVDIPAGVNFRDYLAAQVTACDVLLAIIGPQWVSIAGEDGRPRLHDPDDFVRLEVASGLGSAHMRVVPVLIQDTPMPKTDDLPEPLADLHYRNAVRVRYDPDFTRDMERLIAQIGGRQTRIPRWLGLAAAVALLLVLGVALLLGSGVLNGPPTTPGADAPPGEGGGSPAEESVSLVGQTVTVFGGAALRLQPEANADRLAILNRRAEATVHGLDASGEWLDVELAEGGLRGWVPLDQVEPEPVPAALGSGFGAVSNRWAVYFTDPDGDVSPDRLTYSGIDLRLADSIQRTQNTLDIAAFEFDHPLLRDAVLEAHRRGVAVRVVTDNEFGLDVAAYQAYLAAPEDEREDLADEMETLPDETLLDDLHDSGIPVVDDGRSALMHNNFVILDGQEVWTGHWTYILGDTYRNNSNALTIFDPAIVSQYQAEFDEMFEGRQFGPTSPPGQASEAGAMAAVYFTPEDDPEPAILEAIGAASESVRFMVFSFTLDSVGDLLLELAGRGVAVQGIQETVGSLAQYGEFVRLACAGIPVRSDGNRFLLHHGTFIIDDTTIITGSLNFSSNAMQSNDENVLILRDPALAREYNAEFERLWAQAGEPDPQDYTCGG